MCLCRTLSGQTNKREVKQNERERMYGVSPLGSVSGKYAVMEYLKDLLVSGETLQLRDYSKLDWEWSIFDTEAKKRRHETVFPQECTKAYEMGAALTMNDKA